ncbi:dihydrofolate reductase family protein [Bogoriella caseilytica]|uniref:Dihydrofolate reductase n=1 Tax=Bogoriella caseilytica TaxID=56055 RepID=A0A3N2BFC3_9MICO|nr:dihydrofolate reductase family protein [Bogoriella caseilytica]ROR73935.1 dihydrofolate reductase [Bogoriella caseilytica]
MRKLVYYVAVSIDGYIADPTGGFDDFLIEGDHAAVVFGEYADALPAHAHAALGTEPPRTRFDTVIMGWNTLTPALDIGIISPYPHLRQVVASRRRREVDPAITLTDDPLATVRRLKQEEGLDVWLCGGGELAGSLLSEIDHLVLKRSPVVFRSGIPMFGHAPYEPRTFERARTRTFDSGVVIEDYVCCGRASSPGPT